MYAMHKQYSPAGISSIKLDLDIRCIKMAVSYKFSNELCYNITVISFAISGICFILFDKKNVGFC